jgi:D-alanyl-D-alanine dipeptidase
LTVSRKREDVQARHQEIQRLRRKPRFTLKAIAAAVGLTDHTTVWWHLSGNCTCLTRTNIEWVRGDEQHTHVWKCKCGARG